MRQKRLIYSVAVLYLRTERLESSLNSPLLYVKECFYIAMLGNCFSIVACHYTFFEVLGVF